MKRIRRISYYQLVPQLPFTATVVGWLTMDHFKPTLWGWRIFWGVIVVLWLAIIFDLARTDVTRIDL